jgi:hypothetical protein
VYPHLKFVTRPVYTRDNSLFAYAHRRSQFACMLTVLTMRLALCRCYYNEATRASHILHVSATAAAYAA